MNITVASVRFFWIHAIEKVSINLCVSVNIPYYLQFEKYPFFKKDLDTKVIIFQPQYGQFTVKDNIL